MSTTLFQPLGRSLAVLTAFTIFGACSDSAPDAPTQLSARPADFSELASADHSRARDLETERAIATLRRVTARYHSLDLAIKDGFVLLHDCETRLNDEPVGTVYYNPARLTDGVINPAVPDALVYEPGTSGAPPELVAVELAIPFTQWNKPQPPTFLGATFQREDEFGVFGLHAWVWRKNPNGLFAETTPRVSCGTE